MAQVWLWMGFSFLILGMLAIDLGILNRHSHQVTIKSAARWSIVVVLVAAAFNAWIFFQRGAETGLEFTAGYVIELALSVDNIFVFILIFRYFKVPAAFQHRVLIWGIIGAILLRGVMIASGWLLIERFHWVIYVFGAVLIFSGLKMAKSGEIEIDPEANPVLKLMRRFVPIAPNYDGQRFFTRAFWGTKHRYMATPLFVVLCVVDATDVVFALDSIPAIFAVTLDPFVIFTSNVFAILALRSMYFVLAGVLEKFHYLVLGLSVVLTFVGVKMLITFWHVEVPVGASLGVVAGVLAISIIASLLFPPREEPSAP
jgi:tellurite resistance protein TerC